MNEELPLKNYAHIGDSVFIRQTFYKDKKMKEYKVFLYSENVFSSIFFNGGKVNPLRLTEALNAQAEEGWEVKTMEKENRRTLLFFTRETLVFILERDRK